MLSFLYYWLKGNDQLHSYDEHAQCEDEYNSIITNVHPLVDLGVRDPAPEVKKHNEPQNNKDLTYV